MSARRKTKNQSQLIRMERIIGKRITKFGVDYLVEITNNNPIWVPERWFEDPLGKLSGSISPIA